MAAGDAGPRALEFEGHASALPRHEETGAHDRAGEQPDPAESAPGSVEDALAAHGTAEGLEIRMHLRVEPAGVIADGGQQHRSLGAGRWATGRRMGAPGSAGHAA
ncbi:hypothetical protein GCM10011490_25430 [Pseudoclavibacter endophyticus]|nr:hypothetical protein GCM10011490_25430 [Pseudoclavibacter endophyticus]